MKEAIFTCAGEGAGASEISLPVGKKPRIQSDRLFQGGSEIVIVHQTKNTVRGLLETASSS